MFVMDAKGLNVGQSDCDNPILGRVMKAKMAEDLMAPALGVVSSMKVEDKMNRHRRCKSQGQRTISDPETGEPIGANLTNRINLDMS